MPEHAQPRAAARAARRAVPRAGHGRIEYNIANRLCRAGIEVVAGANGNAADVARGYLTKTLTGVEEVCHIADPTFTIGTPHEENALA